MSKDDQRERFEKAWREKLQPDGDYAVLLFDRSVHTGNYFSIETGAAWRGFQLADNAALEVIAEKDAEIADLVMQVAALKAELDEYWAIKAKVLPRLTEEEMRTLFVEGNHNCSFREFVRVAQDVQELLASQEGA